MNCKLALLSLFALALRRLGRTVQWVNYINGGHGTPTSEVGEVHDYYQRILDWYDKYLKGDEALVETKPPVSN